MDHLHTVTFSCLYLLHVEPHDTIPEDEVLFVRLALRRYGLATGKDTKFVCFSSWEHYRCITNTVKAQTNDGTLLFIGLF